MADERQRGYQKKYDKKTKVISVKYVISDMDDYDRFKKYLERTGQSANGFIKELIKDFFASGRSYYGIHPSKEYEKMEFYKYAEISDESLEKLKDILGNDDEKYNIVLDLYANYLQSEIETALFDKSCEFDEWVDTLEDGINDGEIDMKSLKQFKDDIETSMCDNLREIIYG